jgi:hypothetical protein
MGYTIHSERSAGSLNIAIRTILTNKAPATPRYILIQSTSRDVAPLEKNPENDEEEDEESELPEEEPDDSVSAP